MQEAVAYNTTKPRIGDLQIQNEEKWWTDMKPFALDYTLGGTSYPTKLVFTS